MTSPTSYGLVLDIQATQSPAHGDRGIARYVREQARALLRREVVASLALSPHLDFPKNLDLDLLASPLLDWGTRTTFRRTIEATSRPLAYYVMSPFEISAHAEGDLPPHALVSDVPVVATLYDLIPLILGGVYMEDETFARRYAARCELLHVVDLVLTISEATRRDAITHLDLDPDKVVSIGAGVSPFFHPPTPGGDARRVLARALPSVAKPYVLTVAGGDPRKNTEALLEAWSALEAGVRAAHQLVVACSVDPATRAGWEQVALDVGLGPGEVVLTGWITDDVLRALYQRAELFVFPSRYEGYGLPAAEAVACGCPIVTSSTSSLPEVLDWAPSTFDPTDAASVVASIERGLGDESFRSELRRRGAARRPSLTWDAVAERTVEALDRLPQPSGPAGESHALPVRLALVGPQPPTPSGIADYNSRLVESLAARCELDVFTDDPTLAPVPEAVGRFAFGALGRTVSPYSYDVVVYTAGNSDDHFDLYELASEFPGLLWLHDVRLPGLFITYARERIPDGQKRDFLVYRLQTQYRRRLPHTLIPDIMAEPPDYVAAGIGLTKELVDNARGVVVSSAFAARVLQMDQQPDARRAPLWVVPHAVPDPLAPVPLVDGDDELVVASFGMVSMVKAPDLVVEAFAHLDVELGARLVFVGDVSDQDRARLEAHAAALGIADRVELTGLASRDVYEHWLRRATCAVQLRRATNGESSGAVHECIANGIPVLTNVVGADELPAGVVHLVAPDVSARALTERIALVLEGGDHIGAMRAAQRSLTARWGFDAVADRLLAITGELTANLTTPSGP